MVSQSVVGVPFISMFQTKYSGQRLTKSFQKNGDFFPGISAKAFRKRSVVLTRVEIRSLEVIKGQTFKIGVPTIRITVRDNA